MPHYDEAATTASQNVLGGDVVQTSTDAGCESLLLEVRRFDADSDDLESLPTTTLSIVSTALWRRSSLRNTVWRLSTLGETECGH